MWKSDGLGNAYNPKTKDTIYLNTLNVGYVEVHRCHVQLGYDELLIVKPTIPDAIEYVEKFVESNNESNDPSYFTVPISCLKPIG